MDGQLGLIFDLAKSMGTILVVAFYAAIVIWTYKDARKRTEDPILVASFTAISMLPLFGVFIYMLVRPAEYIADVRERELEIRALESQLSRQERCPHCKSHIEGSYLSCPVCATKLRQLCSGCDKPLDPRWVLCPFCETEVPGRSRPKTPPAGQRRGGSPRADAPRSQPRAQQQRPTSTKPSAKPKAKTRDAGDSDASRPERSMPQSSSAATPKRRSAPPTEPESIRTEPLDPV